MRLAVGIVVLADTHVTELEYLPRKITAAISS
jgi:hypothetical protein